MFSPMQLNINPPTAKRPKTEKQQGKTERLKEQNTEN
jgi:hypothetical protein